MENAEEDMVAVAVAVNVGDDTVDGGCRGGMAGVFLGYCIVN